MHPAALTNGGPGHILTGTGICIRILRWFAHGDAQPAMPDAGRLDGSFLCGRDGQVCCLFRPQTVMPPSTGPALFALPSIVAEAIGDGCLLVQSAEPLGNCPVTVVHSLNAWAARTRAI